MNFSCAQCERRYSIADEKVRGKTVKIRCKHCQTLNTVQGPSEDAGERTNMMSPAQVEQLKAQAAEGKPSEGRAARPAALDASHEWFAMVKGKQQGPLDVGMLQEKVRAGGLTLRTYVWRQGMGDWKRAGEVPELGALFAAPPSVEPVAGPGRAASEPESPSAQQEVPSASSSLNELFSDANSPAVESDRGESVRAAAKDEDPFAMMGDIDPASMPPPGEATRFFIAQAGVNKRNPPWKIALFIGGGLGLPVLILLLLSTLGPKRIVIDETGREVEVAVYSPGAVSSGLKDLLLGKKKPAPPAVAKRDDRPRTGGGSEGKTDTVVAEGPKKVRTKPSTPGQPSAQDMADFYGAEAGSAGGRIPQVRPDEQKALDSATGGLSEQQVAKIVTQTQPAFQFCIEQAMKKNPNFKGGKITLVATVGTSGSVKKAAINRRDIDSSELGECLKGKAKKMIFASFAGDETDVEIPLILSGTL